MLVGGAGFIGHHLALALREKDADVMVVDHLQVNNIVHMLSSNEYSTKQREIYIKFIIDRFDIMRNKELNLLM